MKFMCTCGAIIRDQSDYLPHKANIVSDEDFFDLYGVLDQLMVGAPKDPDVLNRHTLGFWRAIYQCPACGRIYLQARGRLFEFTPTEDDTPRNLLTGARAALFGQIWEELTAAPSSDNRLAWERELAKEISHGHPLHAQDWHLIARRRDCDDALLELASGGYAVVHLTWSARNERPPWPETTFYRSLRDLAECEEAADGIGS